MDGKGYPDGLPGHKIPLIVRILSVADVYDAISSDRPYRAALPLESCLPILCKDASDGGLDPELVKVFCSIPVAQLVRIGSGVVPNLTSRVAHPPDPASNISAENKSVPFHV
jgi:HD-GYP domain-containing protein (c-di-GMP phosphodiesterase class II)